MSPLRADHLLTASESAAWVKLVAHVRVTCGFTNCLAEVALLRHRGLTEKAVAARLGIPYETAHARFRRLYREHRIGGAIALVLLVERALATIDLPSIGPFTGT
jgi:hypothetical protein